MPEIRPINANALHAKIFEENRRNEFTDLIILYGEIFQNGGCNECIYRPSSCEAKCPEGHLKWLEQRWRAMTDKEKELLPRKIELSAEEAMQAVNWQMPIYNRTCSECGALCFDDDSFCAECGVHFNEEVSENAKTDD